MTRALPRLAPGLAALVVAVAFSGCLSAEAAALDMEPQAHAEARAWDEGARLVLVFGLEATPGTRDMMRDSGSLEEWSDGAMGDVMDAEHWERAERDPNPGNGRAELWAYVYRSGDGTRHIAIVMEKDGRVLTSAEKEGPGDGEPIGEVAVDSDEAVRLARLENAGLERATGGSTFVLTLVLFRESAESNPAWLVAGGGMSGSGGGGGMVLVDAVTGEILMSHGSDGFDGGFDDGMGGGMGGDP